MKKQWLMLLPFLLLLSCSDSDNGDSLKNHPIVGSWQLKDIQYEIDISDEHIGLQVTKDLEKAKSEGLSAQLQIDFSDDGSFQTSSRWEDIGEGRYKVKGTQLTLYDNKTSETFHYTIDFDHMEMEEDQTNYFRNKSIGTGTNLSEIINYVKVITIYDRR